MSPMRASAACIVLLLTVPSLFAPCSGAEVLGYPFCDSLRHPEAKAACFSYINAVSSIGKWTSAVRWARYYKGSCECQPLLLSPHLPVHMLSWPINGRMMYTSSCTLLWQPQTCLHAGTKALVGLLSSCCPCRPVRQCHSNVLADRHACRALWLHMHNSSKQQPL